MSFFGQPPLAALLPLAAGQNLADLPSPTAALANLGTLSTSDIMTNSVPLGTIIPFWGSTAPLGYLPCFGQTINSGTFPSLVTFLGGTSSAVVPDLRGQFLRGWDSGRGLDNGRSNLTTQSGTNLRQTGANGSTSGAALIFNDANYDTPSSYSAYIALTSTTQASVATGTVRPTNVSVLYCIKAYGAVINTSTANMGNVLTQLSNTVQASQFGVNLSTNGYQKLPSGLIIQWGNYSLITTASSVVLTFPIAFPTSGCALTITSWVSGDTNPIYCHSGRNTTGAIVNKTSASISAYQFDWIAIGY